MASPTPPAPTAPPYPNAFLIGAQKCGTTYLASLLAHSPDICVSDPKEPHALSLHTAEAARIYARCFARPDAPVRLDASTTYSFLRHAGRLADPEAPGTPEPVPANIRAVSPEARLIYVLRDPAQRIASHIRGKMRDRPPPGGAVSIAAAMQADPMLRLVSEYSFQIERYLEVFPRERFLFVSFDALTGAPADTVARVCRFLGAAPPAGPVETLPATRHAAHALTGPGRAMHRLRRRAPGLFHGLRGLVPPAARRRLAEAVLRRPMEIRFSDLEEVSAAFEPERRRVEELTGLRL